MCAPESAAAPRRRHLTPKPSKPQGMAEDCGIAEPDGDLDRSALSRLPAVGRSGPVRGLSLDTAGAHPFGSTPASRIGFRRRLRTRSNGWDMRFPRAPAGCSVSALAHAQNERCAPPSRLPPTTPQPPRPGSHHRHVHGQGSTQVALTLVRGPAEHHGSCSRFELRLAAPTRRAVSLTPAHSARQITDPHRRTTRAGRRRRFRRSSKSWPTSFSMCSSTRNSAKR